MVTTMVTIPRISVAPADGMDQAATAVSALVIKVTTRNAVSAIVAFSNFGVASIIRVAVSKASAAHSE